MRRLFWLGIGLAVGVLVVRKLTKMANSCTPQAVGKSAQQSVQNLKVSARAFLDDVKAGAAEHEEQIVAAVLVDQQAAREKTLASRQ